jgi:hypothetical protein
VVTDSIFREVREHLRESLDPVGPAPHGAQHVLERRGRQPWAALDADFLVPLTVGRLAGGRRRQLQARRRVLPPVRPNQVRLDRAAGRQPLAAASDDLGGPAGKLDVEERLGLRGDGFDDGLNLRALPRVCCTDR